MNKVLSVNIIGLVLIYYINIIKTEDYDDNPDEKNGSASVDSESNEIFNASSKEKPQRLSQENVEINYVNGNVPFNITINNGTESTIEASTPCNKVLANYPFSVSIQRKGSHYASGALIHRKWIITVASEFYNIRETIKLFRTRLGSVNCKKGGTLVPLKEIRVHPAYTYKQPNFDIAMLRIGQLFEFSDYIRPIALSEATDAMVSEKYLTTYWPRLIVNGKVLTYTAKERMKPNSMRVSTQKMILWDKCNELMQAQNHSLDKSSLCLTPIMSHHSPCMPDAGAPIIADDGLLGITSGWTMKKCQTHPTPTIVTRISLPPIRYWLDSLLHEGR